jgi:ADP-ribose pyrophosphatase
MLVQHPESVALIVLDGVELVVVRQTRPGTPERTLALPSGKLEPGETPIEAAVRELAEECGLAAAAFRPIGTFWVVPAYSTERVHVFEATDLSAAAGRPDDDEDLEPERIAATDAWRLLSDATSLAALGLWQRGAGRA